MFQIVNLPSPCYNNTYVYLTMLCIAYIIYLHQINHVNYVVVYGV